MVNSKRILYVITKSDWGGAGKYVHDLVCAAKQKGFAVMVAAGGRGILSERLEVLGIPFVSLAGLRRETGAFGAPAVFFKMLKIMFSFRPDILHASSPQAAGIAGAAASIYKLISRKSLYTIFTVHGWSFLESRPCWQNFLIRFLSKITSRLYDRLICVSRFDLKIALKERIAPAQKLSPIHNGISESGLSFFTKNEARQKLPEACLKPDDFVIGTVGEFVKNKGYEYLVAASAALARQDGKIKTVIAAWGKNYEKIRAQIEKEKINANVFLIRDLRPAAPYLKSFDLFVFPSLKEGLPYAVLEAGLAGVPVIASEVGGIPEIIEHEKTGLLIPPASPQKIAEAVLKLKKNPELAKKLAQELRQKVISRFSKEKQLQQTFALYQ